MGAFKQALDCFDNECAPETLWATAAQCCSVPDHIGYVVFGECGIAATALHFNLAPVLGASRRRLSFSTHVPKVCAWAWEPSDPCRD